MGPAMFADPSPPDQRTRGIDIVLGDAGTVLADMPDDGFDLAVVDPPWAYTGTPGAGVKTVGEHYPTLPIETIRDHLAATHRLAKRLAVWHVGPWVAPWMAVADTQPRAAWPWGPMVSMGGWHKAGESNDQHVGIGVHWAGCLEPVLLYTRPGAYTDRSEFMRNSWSEPPGVHSRKPVPWMIQWMRRWVPPGGRVLCVYTGLGSVEEAVLRAGGGRTVLGIEIDPARRAQALALLAQVRP